MIPLHHVPLANSFCSCLACVHGVNNKKHLVLSAFNRHGGLLMSGCSQKIPEAHCDRHRFQPKCMACLAQSVERKALNLVVVGLSPTEGVVEMKLLRNDAGMLNFFLVFFDFSVFALLQ